GSVPAGTIFSWSAPTGSGFTGGAAGSGSTVSGTLYNNGNAPVTATYLISAISGTSPNLCTSSFTLTVTINPVPTANVTSNSPICMGDNAVFIITGTAGATVTYSVNGGASASIQLVGGTATVTVPAVSVNQTLNLLSASATGSPACSQTLNGSSTINVLPSAMVTSNGPICSGQNGIFYIMRSSGNSVTYNLNGGPNVTVPLNNGMATVTINGVTSNQVLNVVSLLAGGSAICIQPSSASVTLVVVPLPTATVTAGAPICSGQNAVFTISGTAGATVTYNLNNGANTTAVLINGTATVSVNGATVGQTFNLVSITSTGAPACSQALTGSASVVVNALPTATVTAGAPICSGQNAVFTISGTAGATVTYNLNNGANTTTVLTNGTATVSVNGATVGQTLNLVSITSTGAPACSQALTGSASV
ncbi:MAG: hypothetical protein ACKO7B_14565, partial [Flavobacteriales bacterium]